MFQYILSTRSFQRPSAEVCVEILLFTILCYFLLYGLHGKPAATGHFVFVLFADKQHKVLRPFSSNEKRARLH